MPNNLLDDNELPEGPDDDGLGRDIDQLPPEPASTVGQLTGERAEFCLCRLCLCGVSTSLTLDNDDPAYKVVTDHCRLGFRDAAQNEVQLCEAYWPRELSLAAWREGRAVRAEARRRAKNENREAQRQVNARREDLPVVKFPGGRTPFGGAHG